MGFFKKRDKPHTAPVPDRGPELDALYTRIRGGDQSAIPAAWNIVLTVPKLYMIARGEMPAIQPYVGVLEQRPMLAVFTTSERAHAFAVAQQLTGPGGAFGTIEQSPPAVIATACNLHRAGVECVIVDMDPKDSTGIYAPITNLIGMYEQATGELLHTCAPAAQGEFDHRIRAANIEQDAAMATKRRDDNLYRLLLLPQWFFVAPRGGPRIPTVLDDGSQHLLVFTDPWSAARSVDALTAQTETAHAMREVPVPEAFEFIRGQLSADPPLESIMVNPNGEHMHLHAAALLNIWDHNEPLRSAHGAG